MRQQCTEPGCSRPAKGQGLCLMHWKRGRRDGSLTLKRKVIHAPPIERIFRHAIFTDSCWLWDGAIQPDGYVRTKVGGRITSIHRLSYEFCVGPIPSNLEIDHLCRVRHCFNPDHLEIVTRRENTLRGESPSAQNARKTHCPRGHPYDAKNCVGA